MAKIITIENKDYSIEYSIEASLYKDCTEKVTNIMIGTMGAERKELVATLSSQVANVPQTTISAFYAGLLEHHGECGDGTVLSEADAKKLLVKYFSEHKGEEDANFFGVMNMLINQMAEDGFFDQIGLTQIVKNWVQTVVEMQEAKKTPKKPQDHKKKEKATEK